MNKPMWPILKFKTVFDRISAISHSFEEKSHFRVIVSFYHMFDMKKKIPLNSDIIFEIVTYFSITLVFGDCLWKKYKTSE